MKSGFSSVNGIEMYYEIQGEGSPLVLIHGGGSTINTTFGRVIHLFARKHQVISVELQAHGRTGDRNTALSFEHDADDVAALLKNLHIAKADIFGFSNGANTALMLAVRHPNLCRKIVAGSPLLKRNGCPDGFWEFMKTGTFEMMPQQLKDDFLKVNPNPERLLNMYHKCANRMIHFKEFSNEEILSIKSPVLIINGEQDVATTAHVEAMSKLIPDCQLLILPGGHGAYIGEIASLKEGWTDQDWAVEMIEEFLSW